MTPEDMREARRAYFAQQAEYVALGSHITGSGPALTEEDMERAFAEALSKISPDWRP
jgi:hypothetical protein